MKVTIRLIAGLVIAAFGSAHSPAQTTDALYEAAKREGALVIVGGGPAPPYEKAAQEFMQRYPGIAVTVSGGSLPSRCSRRTT